MVASMLAVAIVNQSVLLPNGANGAMGSINLTLEKYYAHANFCQYKIVIHNQTSYNIPE